MKNHLQTKLAAVLVISTLLLGGCSSPLSKKAPEIPVLPGDGVKQEQVSTDLSAVDEKISNQDNRIKKFNDYEEFASFLDEGVGQQVYNYGGVSFGESMVVMDDAMVKVKRVESMPTAGIAKEESQATGLGSGASNDFSKTNVQVKGVDEADIIKTDGEFIYAVSNNNLFIVKAFPADKMEIVSKIEFESRPDDIYIEGDRLVIFGNNQLIYKTESYQSFRRQSPFTFLKIFDIADKKNPKLLRGLDFEGNYFDSRLIGDNLYFVTSNYSYYYSPTDSVIPRILENGVAITSDCAKSAKCFAPEIYYFDMPYDSYNLTQVASINIKNPQENVAGDVYVMSSGQNMYVSEKNIYIAYTRNVSEYELSMAVLKEMIFPKLAQSQKDKINEIESVKPYILNESEKMYKIAAILERYRASLTTEEQDALLKDLEVKMKDKYKVLSKELEKTVVHKIAINDGKLEYKNFGEVPGSVLNQFSMDESGDYFRLATTKNQTWSQYMSEEERQSYNNVYVLNSDMKVVGTLEGLAKGERIYSVRFMGTRAYLVTFVQTDPLFVVDLSDPANLKVLGELKIPGYSNYLHPYSDTMLIGFGKDTAATEWGGVKTKGLKLSLFDVSDVANPKEVNTYVMGDAGSDSIALQDHKAFLFSREKNLLSLPVTISEDKENRGWGQMVFSGAAVFKVDEKGFELKGKIDHSDGGKVGVQDCWWGYCYYDNNVLRSLYIGDNLYTFSNKYLKINNIKDLKEVNKIELKKEKKGDDFIIVN